jgi:hypothetical protein
VQSGVRIETGEIRIMRLFIISTGSAIKLKIMGFEGGVVLIGEMKNAYKWRNWKPKLLKQLQDLGSTQKKNIKMWRI